MRFNRFLSMSLLGAVLAVGSTALAGGDGGPFPLKTAEAISPTNPQIHLTVNFPSQVNLNGMMPGPRITVVKATATIKNGSRSDVTLETGGCVASYEVLNAKTMKRVQAFPDVCTTDMKHLPLAAGTSSEPRTDDVKLDGTAIKVSGDYVLRYTFWGISADLRFRANVASLSTSTPPMPQKGAFCGRVMRIDPKSCTLVRPSMIDQPTYDITGVGPKQPKIGELIVGSGHVTGASSCNPKFVHLDKVTWAEAQVCPLSK